MNVRRFFLPVFFLVFGFALWVFTHNEVTRFSLTNGTLRVEVTPDIGGRMLSVSVVGRANILMTGVAVVKEPNPKVSPQADNIFYRGHDVWVGPQSQWWLHQSVNPERLAAKAVWPPDPYLILARNQEIARTDEKVSLKSPNSPVSGIAITKHYSLVAQNPHQLFVDVEAQNIRDSTIAWDIWFNTRVAHNAQIYAPIASVDSVRVQQLNNAIYDQVEYSIHGGIFALGHQDPAQKQGRQGKIFIQPSEGWMAAFSQGQLLIIQFELQPKEAIHPEQGQLEFYQEYLVNDPSDGVIEMELHAPYKTLKPNERMKASEVWNVFPYDGEKTPRAQIAFLQEMLRSLKSMPQKTGMTHVD